MAYNGSMESRKEGREASIKKGCKALLLKLNFTKRLLDKWEWTVCCEFSLTLQNHEYWLLLVILSVVKVVKVVKGYLVYAA